MQVVVRFWVALISLLVSVTAVGYLFATFLFADADFVVESMLTRFAIMFVALLATGVLVWSTVLADADDEPPSPHQRERDR